MIAQYRTNGWATIRVHPCAKAPIGQGWQKRTDEPGQFQPGENVGVRLGDPSQGLVDIDLDCDEACQLAAHYLRPTATFGRPSKPRSHWIYRCPGIRTRKPPRCNVELRSTGTQTVFPPSIHESGEQIAWTDPDKIVVASIDEAALLSAFGRLCAATVIARLTPALQAGRGVHDAVLALAGALHGAGWTQDDAADLILLALELHGGPDPTGHREEAIADTWEDHGRDRTGWPTLARIIGPADAKAIQRAVELATPTTPAAQASTKTGYALNDRGNVDRLVDRFGADLCFVPGLDWLRWDGCRWAPSDGPYCELELLSAEIQQEGNTMGGDAGKAIEAWGRQCGNAGRLRGAVEVASHRAELRTDAARLDANPWLLNCTNGTLDLRTAAIREHVREDLITRTTPVAYDSCATAPRFEQFLLEVFDNDAAVANYVLRYLGSALTGKSPDRAFQVWHGAGANGKSTLIDVLRYVLGDYAVSMSIGLLLASRRPRNSAAASPDLVSLRGVRLASCVETDAGQSWNESLVKQLTGGDVIRARHLHREEIEFDPTWTIVLATNHKPIVRGTDAAIWDRIHLVPFDVRFDESSQDPTLKDKLKAEAPGILRMLVDACRDWQSNGLQTPDRVRTAVQEYRQAQDVVGQFLTECCETGPGKHVPTSKMYRAYKTWSQESGEYVHGKHAFNRIMRERGLTDERRRVVEWQGIDLRSGLDFAAERLAR